MHFDKVQCSHQPATFVDYFCRQDTEDNEDDKYEAAHMQDDQAETIYKHEDTHSLFMELAAQKCRRRLRQNVLKPQRLLCMVVESSTKPLLFVPSSPHHP